jgi:hypothetical protein
MVLKEKGGALYVSTPGILEGLRGVPGGNSWGVAHIEKMLTKGEQENGKRQKGQGHYESHRRVR